MSSDPPIPPQEGEGRPGSVPEWSDFKEAQQMSHAAQAIVNDFDFEAARKFIMNRARQFRAELRSYFGVAALLLVFSGAERLYGKPDNLTLIFDLLLVVVVSFLLWRLFELRALRRGDGQAALRDRAQRQARGVRRERVFNAAMVIVYVLAVALICIDAIAEGSWYWAAVFGLLGVVLIAMIRQYAGPGARARAERYISGEIDAKSYVRGRDTSDKGPKA